MSSESRESVSLKMNMSSILNNDNENDFTNTNPSPTHTNTPNQPSNTEGNTEAEVAATSTTDQSDLKQKKSIRSLAWIPVGRVRRVLDLGTKKEIIALSNTGLSHQSIADKFDIGRSTVTKILLSKERILESARGSIHDSRKRIRRSAYDGLENDLFRWCTHPEDREGIPEGHMVNVRDGLTRDMISAKAAEMAREKGLTNFDPTSVWFHKFKRKYRLELSGCYIKIDGERRRQYGYNGSSQYESCFDLNGKKKEKRGGTILMPTTRVIRSNVPEEHANDTRNHNLPLLKIKDHLPTHEDVSYPAPYPHHSGDSSSYRNEAIRLPPPSSLLPPISTFDHHSNYKNHPIDDSHHRIQVYNSTTTHYNVPPYDYKYYHHISYAREPRLTCNTPVDPCPNINNTWNHQYKPYHQQSYLVNKNPSDRIIANDIPSMKREASEEEYYVKR